jgi:hypothetical protein
MLLFYSLQQIKGSGRFKEKGLQNEDQLEIMFESLHNTGDDHWSASSGLPPSQPNNTSTIDLEGEDDVDNQEDDSEPEDFTPISEQTKRPVGEEISGRVAECTRPKS